MATPAPVSSATSLFISGDIVLQNPKETGVIFGLVVILSVLLENVFGAFRENRSRYVKALFTQVSEEIMIVGTIGLVFVFIVQSVDDLPSRWVMLFRWTTTVLFFLMTLFVIGIVFVAATTTIVINRLKRFERQICDENISLADDLDLSRTQRAFMIFRALYNKQVRYLSDKGAPGSLEKQLCHVPFSKYLEARVRGTMAKFTDVTWQCWLSLLFASSANSVRLFLLPGNLQEKNHEDFTEKDRLLNHSTFILLLGWIPFIGYVISIVMLVRQNNRYMMSVLETHAMEKKKRRGMSLSDSTSSAIHTSKEMETRAAGNAKVWLPPKQLAGELVGDLCEDPSIYLLRGNRSFTLHALKIPTIMIEFYMSIFIVGMWGEMSRNIGVSQAGLVPLALIPFFTIFAFLPVSLLIVTVLTSLGCRLDENELKRLVLRKEKKTSSATATNDGDGDGVVEDDADDQDLQVKLREERQERQAALLEVPSRSEGDPLSSSANLERATIEVAALRARVKFLEDVCASYGIPVAAGDPISDSRDSLVPAAPDASSLATVFVALNKLQEETKKISEQQKQIAAPASPRGGGRGPQPSAAEPLLAASPSSPYALSRNASATHDAYAPPDFSTLEAVSASRQLAASQNSAGGFGLGSVKRPTAHSSSLGNISRAANL